MQKIYAATACMIGHQDDNLRAFTKQEMKSIYAMNTSIASITGFCGIGERRKTTHNKRIQKGKELKEG